MGQDAHELINQVALGTMNSIPQEVDFDVKRVGVNGGEKSFVWIFVQASGDEVLEHK
jgi:hypothetical protein